MPEKPILNGLVRDDPRTPEGKYLVKRRDGSVPEWPSMVLGAADPMVPMTLRFYAVYGFLLRHFTWSMARSIWRYAGVMRQGHPPHGRPGDRGGDEEGVECVTELIPRLLIGNWQEAKSSRGMYVITCAIDSEFVGHEHFGLVDGPGNTKELFDAAVKATCQAHLKGECVLVHCVGGRSRAPAVTLAAAVRLTGRPFCEVYDELLRKHDGSGIGARIHPYLSLLLLMSLAEA